jgi:uncharacterized protein GlcG (DUF336 family)
MRLVSTLAIASLLLASCGGGGGGTPTPSPTPPPTGTPGPSPSPSPTPSGVYTVPAQVALTQADVQKIIAQAAAEATAQGKPASIAIVDRVGNVLAFYVMNGADLSLRVPPPRGGPSAALDLQNVQLPAPAAAAGAIAKAITGAYLSSSGNAFSTRTASQIVQEHFPPSRVAIGLESGPLFGVQFSSLPCSDLVNRFNGNTGPNAFIGPKRSPLGLSADAGGFPLYKNGVVVGGIGVMADGVYGFDSEIQDVDKEVEEIIALAGTQGFAAAEEIRAERITVDGTQLRFSDATPSDFRSNPASPPAFASLPGTLASVPAYYNAGGGIVPGTPYGTEASGYRAASAAEFSDPQGFILTNGSGQARFSARGGTDAGTVAQPLTQNEVRVLLEEAFKVLSRARAQIRRPLDSRMEATISVVDTNGAILGIVRSPDAPIFGTDVSLQKARTAAFFSSARAGQLLEANPKADVRQFAGALRTQAADPQILNGKFAITARAIGNIARPYFPDGEVGRPHGALSRPIESFSPFSTGLQSALILDNVFQHVGALLNGTPDTPARCTATPDVAPGQNPLQNGIQIFPGGEPIYRGGQLVGAIGLSGDGIDQDDMVGFLGIFNAGQRLGTIGHPDPNIRSDRIEIPTGERRTRLRYVNCPFAPFVGSSEQNVCQGI